MVLSSCGKREAAADLLIQDVYIYCGPNLSEIQEGNILIKKGRIAEIVKKGEEVPAAKETLSGKGLFAYPSFWNCHVHFSEAKWSEANSQEAASLQANLDKMFNQYGFTSVLDIGSDLNNTLAIKKRIESGELKGPHIITAGSGYTSKGASPSYLEVKLPELVSVEQAKQQVAQNIAAGAKHIKLFTGIFVSVDETAVMPPEIALSAVEEAHRQACLVSAHPQSLEGLHAAIYADVDLVAHTIPHAGKLSEETLQKMVQQKMTLVPTLKLWRYEFTRFKVPEEAINALETNAVNQLRDFKKAGGSICFGTDVGYMEDYDSSQEFELMQEAGLNYEEILGSLTTAPEKLLGDIAQSGTIEVGKYANIVLLTKNPKENVQHYSNVGYTIRQGAIVYQNK